MAVGNTFVVEKVCPICGGKTHVVKTRSRLMALATDCDYCVHYKDFNPYYYTIWVCENCSYAADEKTFTSPMPERNRAKIREFLDKHDSKNKFEFHEMRNLADTVASFKLAIFFAELINSSLAHRAGLYLKLAWVYRLSGETEQEAEAMRKAVGLYDQSIVSERYPLGNMTDTMAIYLTGALSYRLGDYEKAASYLSRIIGDKTARFTEPKLFEKAKYLWADVRAARENTGAEKK